MTERRGDAETPREECEPTAPAGQHGDVAPPGEKQRDTTPALGTRGEPGEYRRAVEGAPVALARRAWGDARWSYLYRSDTSYAAERPGPDEVAGAARQMRAGEEPGSVYGPIVKPPVWTWQVPLYFWFGGIASGSAFVALACDLAGDRRSAATARKLALAACVPCPPLLVADLGRPERFLHMLRILKPRSPMSTGAWCLTLFGNLGAAAVAADLLGRPRAARSLGAANALVGAYLGSYTGVLLATTAVPIWARSRLFLGPIFVATATATGASASRLALTVTGLPERHPSHVALGRVETGAMLVELALAAINERRLGRLAAGLHHGTAGRLFRGAKLAVAAGVAARALQRALGPHARNAASGLYLAAGLAFRHAWVAAGKASAADDEAVALMAREPRARQAGSTRPAPA